MNPGDPFAKGYAVAIALPPADGTSRALLGLVQRGFKLLEAGMRGDHRPAEGFATLAALIVAVTMAISGTGAAADKTEPPSVSPVTPEVTILNKHEVEGILGREVRSATDENMGRVVDVLVDRSGLVRAAIIDFGGFLGVGSRKIAVDWNALHFPAPAKPGGRIVLELSRDQLNAAPAYQDGKPVVVLGSLGKLEPLPE